MPTSLNPESGSSDFSGTYPIRYQIEDVAEATAAAPGAGILLGPADSVGRSFPASSGTLGGFVQDSGSGTVYGVTCGHVVDTVGTDVYQPGPKKGPKYTSIGAVNAYSLPPKSLGVCCNNQAYMSPVLDYALIDLDPSVVANYTPGYPHDIHSIKQMTTGDDCYFVGDVSGRQDATVEDLHLWREVEIDGTRHCYGDLFSISPRPAPYVHSLFGQPGDSGSWVITDDPVSQEWAGMLVASKGSIAYCCFAENIQTEISSHFSPRGLCTLP